MTDRVVSRLNPDGLRSYPGTSQIVIVDGLAFIGGQVPVDLATGEVVGRGDLDAQARQVFSNLRAACHSLGESLSSVVKTTTYVTDRASIRSISVIREEVFGEAPPANATIVVSGFAHPDMLIEIDAIAAV